MAYITGKFETKAQILAMRFAKAKLLASRNSKNDFLFLFTSKNFHFNPSHSAKNWVKYSFINLCRPFAILRASGVCKVSDKVNNFS